LETEIPGRSTRDHQNAIGIVIIPGAGVADTKDNGRHGAMNERGNRWKLQAVVPSAKGRKLLWHAFSLDTAYLEGADHQVERWRFRSAGTRGFAFP